MWKMYKKIRISAALLLLGALLAGCSMLSEERVKLRDLEFTILGEELIPEELKSIIEEKKTAPFQLTYSDQEFLYICIGYGEQETGGYSIAVNECYLTDAAIYINASLLGPDTLEKNNKTPSYPYIILKMEYLDQTVIFE